MSLLADFGGFNDGLFLVASSFMAFYSKSMFKGSFSEQFPVRYNANKRGKKNKVPDSVYSRLERGQNERIS